MPQDTGNEVQWPPRSPHEALLSTPRGRARLQRLVDRTSPTPSPSKRMTWGPTYTRSATVNDEAEGQANDDDDDDDEETLQLQLAEIQARLKLKKLQKSKSRQDAEGNESDAQQPALSRSSFVARSNTTGGTRAHSSTGFRDAREAREASPRKMSFDPGLQVPVSPVRRIQPNEPRSPGRVLLGIDKGLKGSDISLKRAPSLRKPATSATDGENRYGGYLQRSDSRAGTAAGSSRPPPSPTRRPLSFNERLTSMRADDIEQRERRARIEKARTRAFDIDQKEMESLKANAIEFPDLPTQAPEFTRDQVLSSFSRPTSGLLHRSRSSSQLPNLSGSTRPPSSASTESSAITASYRRREKPDEVAESKASEFEPYSSTKLSKRVVPHTRVARTLTDKRIFTIPDLLKTVKGPDFILPEVEEDIVIMGIMAQKSEPRAHKASSGIRQKKYMVMTLTDLKWWVELFLFDEGFEKYWKLTPGAVVAILNPKVLPPPPGRQDTNRFSLSIDSGDDAILEIGTASDLGFCKSIKKDGKTCGSWVDKRRTEFCDFHITQSVQKTKAGRMEVNTMNFGQGGIGARKHNSAYISEKSLQPRNVRYDRESGSTMYINRSSAPNQTFVEQDGFHRRSKEQVTKERLAEREREEKIMAKLGSIGTGLGADYMRRPRASQSSASSSQEESRRTAPDANYADLLSGSSQDVQLSPVSKRKRNGTASSTTGSIGWGKNLTQELTRLRNGENLQPVKKKTRFLTDRGIKIAGRESFGGDVATGAGKGILDDDDDDDLDIIP